MAQDWEPALSEITKSVLAGNCVAFVGAGFSMPVVKGWRELLTSVANELGYAKAHPLVQAIGRGDAFRLEAIAQALSDQDADRFGKAIRQNVDKSGEPLSARAHQLSRIPFKAIVTTNFDPSLKGLRPGARELVNAMQARAPVWTRHAGSEQVGRLRPTRERVLKLHGDLDNPKNAIVLGRRDYRMLVHGRPGYTAMLGALLASSDVLFLGVSFTDAYLNELRQQVLQWFTDFQSGPEARKVSDCMPVRWWALMPDVPDELADALYHHEGLKVIPYATAPTQDHGAFDRFLRALAERASLTGLLASRLLNRPEGGDILWFDEKADNNRFGLELLRTAMNGIGEVHSITDRAQFTRALQGTRPILVITRQGYREKDAEWVLDSVRGRGLPVIVFASGDHVDENRWRLRAAGAVDYCHRWEDLFRVLAELLETDEERNARLTLQEDRGI